MTWLQDSFPITLSAHWQVSSQPPLSAELLNWLNDPNSLTARLKRHCKIFRVEVVGQRVEACDPNEANLTIKANEQVLVREVILYCDEQPQVFARSLLPLRSLTGNEQQLANLGTQPLGQVIFNNPLLERQSIEIASFDQLSNVAKLSRQLSLNYQHELWGRRSLFVLGNKPIMVAEVFLPESFAYQHGVHSL